MKVWAPGEGMEEGNSDLTSPGTIPTCSVRSHSLLPREPVLSGCH